MYSSYQNLKVRLETQLFYNKIDYPYMSSNIADICADIMNHTRVRNSIKEATLPLAGMILAEIYPYIYFSLIFIIISFILHVGIFGLLVRHTFPMNTKVNLSSVQ